MCCFLPFQVFLFIDASDEKVDEVKKAFGGLAKEHKGKGLRFLIADTEDGQNALQVHFTYPFFLFNYSCMAFL